MMIRKSIDDNNITKRKKSNNSIDDPSEFEKSSLFALMSVEVNPVSKSVNKSKCRRTSGYYYRVNLRNLNEKESMDIQNKSLSYLVMGELSEMNGDIKSAIKYYDKALKANEGSAALNSVILNSKGIAEIKEGEIETAIDLFKDALRYAKRAKSKRYASTILSNIGSTYRSIGNLNKANKYFSESIELAKEIKDNIYAARLLNNIGDIMTAYGQIENAKNKFLEALNLLKSPETYEEVIAKAVSLRSLAKIYKYEDELNKAEKLYRECLTLLRDSNLEQIRTDLIDVLVELSIIFAESGKSSDSESVLLDARELAKKTHSREDMVKIDSGLAEVLKINGNSKEAIEVWKKVQSTSDKLGMTELSIRSRLSLAIEKINMLNLEEARQILWEVVALARTLNIPVILVEALIAQANVLALEGNVDEALDVINEAFNYLDNADPELVSKVKLEKAKIKALKEAKKGYEIAEMKQDNESTFEIKNIVDYISEIDAFVKINM